jgi:hypothetical protein
MQSSGSVQRIGRVNAERFLAARLADPSLSFDRWVDRLFQIAQQCQRPEVSKPAPGGRMGRPSGAPGRGVTGTMLGRVVAAYLLSRPQHAANSHDVIEHIEAALARKFTPKDMEFTAARVARWQHAVYSQVAYLRSRGIIEKPVPENRSLWKLTASGTRWAQSLM